MGTLSCGCEIMAGMPVSPEMVKAHKGHTLEAMFLWDLVIRPNATEDQTKARDALAEARIAYQDALGKAYPD